jgi:hypothetical protein
MTEHEERLRRIADKIEQVTGRRPQVLDASPANAARMEAVLDTMLAEAEVEARDE